MAIGSGIRGDSKDNYSRRARAIEAVDAKGKAHPCPTITAACELTGISPPTIKASIENGAAKHARGSADLWTFRFADDAEKPTAAAPAPGAIVRQWDNSTAPVAITGRGESLPGALAAVASMGAGYGGLTLSNVSVTGRPDGSWELKFEKLEIARGT